MTIEIGNGYMNELLEQDRCPACRTYLQKSEEGWTCPTCSLVVVEKKDEKSVDNISG
jgi:uncharacterized Zn finger protein (UPF0148 family)